MKVTNTQMKLTKNYIAQIFFVIFACLIFDTSIFAQPQLNDRTKDFGKSLKKYDQGDDTNAKNKELTKDEDTIRVETNLVMTEVLVSNSKGTIITGLKKEDFIITEDDVSQEIELFAIGENKTLPRSIVLIFDYSGSLFPYINNSVEAAKLLIDKLNPNDKMAIVTDDVKLLIDFTKDKMLLKNTLDKLKKKTLDNKGGRSNQYSALLAVLNEIFAKEDVRPIIILQSDGDEITMLKRGVGEYPLSETLRKFYIDIYGERSFSYGDLMSEVEKSRSTIYSIIPGRQILENSAGLKNKKVKKMTDNGSITTIEKKSSESENFISMDQENLVARQKSMFEIAKLSGGYTDYIEKPEDAKTVYSTIFQTIENRYIIGYYPKNEAKDGKRRKLKIEVKGHPEYIITGRKSYTAPIEEK